jgi:hypothetical protein
MCPNVPSRTAAEELKALPSEQEIDAAKTERGGWKKAQLAEWGIPWPPPPGWKRKLIADYKAGRLRPSDYGKNDGR